MTTAQKKGLRYQKVVTRWFKRQAIDHAGFFPEQWIEFCDEDGRGYAQPDLFLLGPEKSWLLLIECKYTQSPSAGAQIEFYSTLLQQIFPDHLILKVQVCRNLVVLPKLELSSPLDLIDRRSGGIWTWQFLG